MKPAGVLLFSTFSLIPMFFSTASRHTGAPVTHPPHRPSPPPSFQCPAMTPPRLVSCLSLFLTVCVVITGRMQAAELPDDFLNKHCLRCHGPEKQERNLQINTLSRDFKSAADTHLWAEILERINSGEMPPETEPQPTQQEIAAVVASLDALLKEGRAARMAARPAVSHYRLSRKEYQNTVYDLLGVRYDPAKPGELNEDTLWHGFERIGSQLSLSPSHVDRYFKAAGIVLDRASLPPLQKLVRFERQPPNCVTMVGNLSRKHSTASASNAHSDTCSFPAVSRQLSHPAGSAAPVRNTADSTKFAFRPAESGHSADSPPISVSVCKPAKKPLPG